MNEFLGQLDGEFSGYDDGAIFRLTNGEVWQQSRYKYKYKYKYRPRVRLFRNDGRWFMEFDCMDEPVEVVRVELLDQGCIVSDFNGFDTDARFRFENGNVWVQAEYKYSYHYAYRPNALVVDGLDGVVLSVDGMSDTVKVRRG